MGNEKICIASKTVELAESETYLEMTNRLCYYDAPNANGVMLPSDGAKERAETLVDMPVVARYRVNAKGEPDLGGHECYINPVTGEVEFHTENIVTMKFTSTARSTHSHAFLQNAAFGRGIRTLFQP